MSISTGAVATIKSLIKHYDLNFEIEYTDHFGVSQARTIGADDRELVDFAIVPEGPFLLTRDGRISNYRRLFPIFAVEQRILRKKGGPSRLGRPLVAGFEKSSADEQLLLKRNLSHQFEEKLVPFSETPEAIIHGLRPGDSLILWEPALTTYGRHGDIEVDPTVYDVLFSMYCHKRWRNRALRDLKNAIMALFIDEWRFCREHPDSAWLLIKRDSEYLREFSRGMYLNKAIVDE